MVYNTPLLRPTIGAVRMRAARHVIGNSQYQSELLIKYMKALSLILSPIHAALLTIRILTLQMNFCYNNPYSQKDCRVGAYRRDVKTPVEEM